MFIKKGNKYYKVEQEFTEAEFLNYKNEISGKTAIVDLKIDKQITELNEIRNKKKEIIAKEISELDSL